MQATPPLLALCTVPTPARPDFLDGGRRPKAVTRSRAICLWHFRDTGISASRSCPSNRQTRWYGDPLLKMPYRGRAPRHGGVPRLPYLDSAGPAVKWQPYLILGIKIQVASSPASALNQANKPRSIPQRVTTTAARIRRIFIFPSTSLYSPHFGLGARGPYKGYFERWDLGSLEFGTREARMYSTTNPSISRRDAVLSRHLREDAEKGKRVGWGGGASMCVASPPPSGARRRQGLSGSFSKRVLPYSQPASPCSSVHFCHRAHGKALTCQKTRGIHLGFLLSFFVQVLGDGLRACSFAMRFAATRAAWTVSTHHDFRDELA